MYLSKYKQKLRALGISHQEVAEYTGHARETVTLWLNGKKPPEKMITHLTGEIEELIKGAEKKPPRL